MTSKIVATMLCLTVLNGCTGHSVLRNEMNFHQEDVVYKNTQADVTLAGTLTLPESKDKSPKNIGPRAWRARG